MQKRVTVPLSTSLAWPAWSGFDRAELFSEPGTNFFAQPFTCYSAAVSFYVVGWTISLLSGFVNNTFRLPAISVIILSSLVRPYSWLVCEAKKPLNNSNPWLYSVLVSVSCYWLIQIDLNSFQITIFPNLSHRSFRGKGATTSVPPKWDPRPRFLCAWKLRYAIGRRGPNGRL